MMYTDRTYTKDRQASTRCFRYAKKKKRGKRRDGRVFSKLIFAALVVFSILTAINITVIITSASPAKTEARNKYYTSIAVEQGDTMWDIASEYMTDEYSGYDEYISEIMKINSLATEDIRSGSRICIPYYADEPLA